ncbi:tryptophan-rich sensory protein [Candidatus Uhrbacteria bacterium]|nr:tryptophan-rich sensory protein [Candidatus Uhrbacteria bacterium]
MKQRDILKLLIAIVISQAAGIIGSFFTSPAIPTWYATLVRPPLNPPSWVFAPVWTTLFLLMGIAAFLVWRRGLGRKDVRVALTVFGVQLGLNTLWSILFFGLQNPFLSLIEIVVLWSAIAATIGLFSRISKPAAYLLVPYLLWVSFATYLNAAYWLLNRS